MKKLTHALSGILLAFLLTVPAFAQEATPTIEAPATEVPAPTVTEPVTDVHTAVDDVIDFFTNNLPTIFLGIGLLMAVFKIKEPQSATEYQATKQEITRLREDAKKTETKIDDIFAEARNLVNEMRGISQTTISNPDPTPPTPTVSNPPVGNTGSGNMDVSTPPVVFVPDTVTFMDTFGKRGDNSYTWQTANHPDAVIEIPDGYDYHLTPYDADGKWYPYKAVNTNAEYGTRLNIASVAGKHKFTRKQKVTLGTGRHEIVLSYIADVKYDESKHPMYNWIWVEAFVDGKPVLIGTDTINHRALQNGTRVASWVFTNDTARDVTLAFEITVHYGTALDMSVIDLKAFGLEKA